eukprot:Phypoly_transcript_02170.p1 GENE.Phypoly_transcript_02170~~Phypoly_transcript_02170.p1  ORF type:complete len:966 (+),score=91.89 Phypoly_transcript_02170:35-2932(+)
MKRTREQTSSVVQQEPRAIFTRGPGVTLPISRTPTSKPNTGGANRAGPSKHQFDVDLQSIQDHQRKIRLETLIQLSNAPLSQDVPKAVAILRRQLKIESDNDIKVLVIKILCTIACAPTVDSNIIIEDLLEQVKSTSRKVQLQVLKALLTISKTRDMSGTWHLSIAPVVKAILSSPNPHIRAAAILLISYISDKSAHTTDEVQKTLASFTEDPDPRVRAAAFHGMYIQHQRGIELDMKLYSTAVNVMNDDYELVRVEAIKIIWVLSNSNPNYILSVNYGEKLRLVDNGFAKLCQGVMDAEPSVRTLACSLMGNFKGVSPHFLKQTLTKKALKASSAGGNASEDNHSVLTGTDPEGEIAVGGDQQLIEAGAAGAFVHGLEDEYMEVRSAAIDSICELSLQSNQFAIRAVEFLVDMFSDELESVRVNSIASVRKICATGKIELREEQLHVVLAVLEDAGVEVRMATHKLLGHTKLSNITCLHASVQALIHNMIKYPQDRESIMLCLRELGKRHPSFTEFIVEDLLHIDPRFISVEPNMDDLSYNCMMVVLLNSAKFNRTILALLPPYCRTHYHFLKDRFPDYFPDLDWEGIGLTSEVQTLKADRRDIQLFLVDSVERLETVGKLIQERKFAEAEKALSQCSRDLVRVAKLDAALRPNTSFYSLNLKLLRILLQVRQQQLRVVTPVLAGKILKIAYKMQFRFLGLDHKVHIQILLWRVFAHLIHLVSVLANTDNQGSKEEATRQINTFIKRLRHVQRICSEFECPTPPEIESLVDAATQMLSPSQSHNILNPLSHAASTTHLLSLLAAFTPTHIALAYQLKLCAGSITSPTNPISPTADKFVHDVYSVFPLRLDIDATLENINNISSVKILVRFPDKSTKLFSIEPTHFVPVRAFTYQIKGVPIILHLNKPNSPEQYCISISLVMTTETDIPLPDLNLIPTVDTPTKDYVPFVSLCKPMNYFLSPRDT